MRPRRRVLALALGVALLAAPEPAAAGGGGGEEGGRLARGLRRVLPDAVDRRLGDVASPGPLAAAHAALRGITRCGSCHTLLGGTADADCRSCHETVAERMDAGRGVHGGFTGACGGCHADHRGAGYDLLGLDREAFNHDRALFALRGAHAGVECDDCHVRPDPETGEPRFSTLGIPHERCADCHEDPHGETLVRARDCGACHTETGWSAAHGVTAETAAGEAGTAEAGGPVGFDHDADTRFALDALHAPRACADCHAGAPVAGAVRPPLPPRDCAGCHRDARALLDGRFAGRERGAPDPHHELACGKCHPAERPPERLPEYGAVCRDCHAPAYARLLLDQRRVLDEALVETGARLRRWELASRRGDARVPDDLERRRDWLARLAASGLHHPELAEALARSLVPDAGRAP